MNLHSNPLSRRRLVAIVATTIFAGALPTVGLTPAIAGAVDAAPGEVRFRSLSVDTQPLADKGLSNYAVRVAKAAGPILDSVFAGRLTPGDASAPRLVIRIDEISFNDTDGGSGFGFIGGTDSISGAGELVDAKGKVIKMQPVTTSLNSIGVGSSDIDGEVNLRTDRLITVLAEWVKREI